MDAWPRHADAERAAAERGSPHAPAAPPHVSRRVSGLAPRSHLLRGGRGGGTCGTAADAPFPDGVRSPAARGGAADTPSLVRQSWVVLTGSNRGSLAFFLELFLAQRQKARRGTKGLAVVVHGEAADVK